MNLGVLNPHLANIITVLRIFGVGFIFWMTPFKSLNWQLVTVLIYILICLTDFLDGWIARKMGIETDIGKILDPLADKILVLVFLPLLEMQMITSFPVFIILSREYVVMALRVIAAKNGTIMAAQFSGKLKTAFTLPVCGILMGRVVLPETPVWPVLEPLNLLRLWVLTWPNWTIQVLIYSTVLITLWSFFDYFGEFIWQAYLIKWKGNEEKAKHSLRAIIPNMFSFLNLFAGILAVILSVYHEISLAVLCIVLGVFFDSIDGALARRLNVSSAMGKQLDSMADLISFGVAPAVLVFNVLMIHARPIWIVWGLSILCFLSVYYRLKRFNHAGHSVFFQGLPSPMGAGIIAYSAISTTLVQWPYFEGIIVIIIALMVSTVPYAHLSLIKDTRLFKWMRSPYYVLIVLSLLALSNGLSFNIPFLYEFILMFTTAYLLTPLFIKQP